MAPVALAFARTRLQQANALLSFLTILGPTVAALLVASVGAGWALACDAASWLTSAELLSEEHLSDGDGDERAEGVAAAPAA